jgi:hypothetical protein
MIMVATVAGWSIISSLGIFAGVARKAVEVQENKNKNATRVRW